jgi:hypothetical protein
METNYAIRACVGKLTVDDINNADVNKLLTDEIYLTTVFYWTSQYGSTEVLETFLERTKVDVNRRELVSEY